MLCWNQSFAQVIDIKLGYTAIFGKDPLTNLDCLSWISLRHNHQWVRWWCLCEVRPSVLSQTHYLPRTPSLPLWADKDHFHTWYLGCCCWWYRQRCRLGSQPWQPVECGHECGWGEGWSLGCLKMKSKLFITRSFLYKHKGTPSLAHGAYVWVPISEFKVWSLIQEYTL